MVLYCILHSSGHSDPMGFEKMFPEIGIATDHMIFFDYRFAQSNAVVAAKNTNGFLALDFAEDGLTVFELGVLP